MKSEEVMENKNKKVVVVGAGLGGLSAAVSLLSEGFQVDIYEKNERVGGKLNILKQDGFTFDLGPSILTMPHIFRTLFTRAGKRMEDYVPIQEVIPHWRNFFEDGTIFDFTSDIRQMEVELGKIPGGGTEGFFKFLEYSRQLTKLTEEGYFAKGLDNFWELVRFYGPLKSLRGFDVFRTLDQGVRHFVKNEKLVDALNYFIKYVGSSPYDAPALLNLMPYIQWGYGLWYVKGGLYNLGVGMERLLKELGGRVHTNCEVVGVERSGGRVQSIVLKGNEKVTADLFVSNMEVIPAYRDLFNESPGFLKTYEKFEPACSGLVLHLGVNRIYPELAHHNFFYAQNAKKHFDTLFHRQDLSQDPTIYLVAPCKSDPSQAPEGCEVIKILPHIPHLRDENPFTREDYLALRERLLVKLERMGLTNLRKHIITEDMWTPHDIQQRYYSNKGAIYGVVSDRKKNLGFKAPQRSETYKNLYFVGGSVNPGGGMPMVVLSGQLVRDKILQDSASGRHSS
ncbi:MAG: Diapolycopene oxygenase [Elusimicrobia bacterium]|nr:Diapolycopene oxygenase [Elusimicrobiota bacterium]